VFPFGQHPSNPFAFAGATHAYSAGQHLRAMLAQSHASNLLRTNSAG
jgi:hypothetical protein